VASSPPPKPRRTPSRVAFATLATASFVLVAAAARALPPPGPPEHEHRRGASPEPSPSATSPIAADPATLPFGSTVVLVLDDRISSSTSTAGSIVRYHLRDPLVVGTRTLAPAGTRGTISVVRTTKAGSGDVDGTVAIHLEPLTLPGDGETAVPLHAREFLAIERSAGELSTRALGDQAMNVFVPYGVIYQVFRKGRQFVLPVGTIVQAQTAAIVRVGARGAVTIETPQPFVREYDTPHAEITAAPLYTPAQRPAQSHPRGRATVAPRLTPTPEPSPSAEASVPVPSADVSVPVPSARPTAASVAPSPAQPASAAPSAR